MAKASVHDVKEADTLIENAQPHETHILGDEGYLGKQLQQQVKKLGYSLWTPWWYNMKGAKEHKRLSEEQSRVTFPCFQCRK